MSITNSQDLNINYELMSEYHNKVNIEDVNKLLKDLKVTNTNTNSNINQISKMLLKEQHETYNEYYCYVINQDDRITYLFKQNNQISESCDIQNLYNNILKINDYYAEFEYNLNEEDWMNLE